MARSRIMADVIHPAFYWIGVILAAACFTLTLGSNTELLWRFEHAGLPLSRIVGAVSIFALLSAELSHSASAIPAEVEVSTEVLQQEA